MAHHPYIERAAAKLGYSKAAVLKWRQRQVPYKARLEILRCAAVDGVPLTFTDFIAAPTPPAQFSAGPGAATHQAGDGAPTTAPPGAFSSPS